MDGDCGSEEAKAGPRDGRRQKHSKAVCHCKGRRKLGLKIDGRPGEYNILEYNTTLFICSGGHPLQNLQ